MITYSDNFDQALRAWDPGIQAHGEYLLIESNTMEYAVYLHDREAYFVFNDQHLAAVVEAQLKRLMSTEGLVTRQHIVSALRAAGIEDINWLHELTGRMRPPVKAGEGQRQARQGRWADVTGNLAAAYRFDVKVRA